MNQRTGAMVLLVVGVVLLVMGLQSSESAVSELSRIFNGQPSRDARLLLGGGIACLAAGGWLLRSPRKHY